MKHITLNNYGVLEHRIPKSLLESLRAQAKRLMKRKYTEEMKSELIGNKPPHFFLDDTKDLFGEIDKMVKVYEESYAYAKNIFMLSHSSNLRFGKPWVNVQKDDQYIPNHIHDGVYAYACWIDIPYKTIFEFSYNNILGNNCRQQWEIGPMEEGKMFLFPSSLVHCTYTLEKSKKKRLCVSGHLAFNTEKE